MQLCVFPGGHPSSATFASTTLFRSFYNPLFSLSRPSTKIHVPPQISSKPSNIPGNAATSYILTKSNQQSLKQLARSSRDITHYHIHLLQITQEADNLPVLKPNHTRRLVGLSCLVVLPFQTCFGLPSEISAGRRFWRCGSTFELYPCNASPLIVRFFQKLDT